MQLSVVVPVYRERASLRELARRCSAAADQTELDYEVLFVDDASGDGSPDLVRDFPLAWRAQVVELPRNQGQFGATQAGLQHAAGDVVVVLDGDLQDPPEVIRELVAEHQRSPAAPGTRVTFAVKLGREDPMWFLAGRRVFRLLQRCLGAGPPRNAGSYCAMDREIANQVARVHLNDANLAWVVAALGYSGGTVGYFKQGREDGPSRMGPVRLLKEAVGSLFIVSPFGRRWLRHHV